VLTSTSRTQDTLKRPAVLLAEIVLPLLWVPNPLHLDFNLRFLYPGGQDLKDVIQRETSGSAPAILLTPIGVDKLRGIYLHAKLGLIATVLSFRITIKSTRCPSR
jgi:hypothetical protein